MSRSRVDPSTYAVSHAPLSTLLMLLVVLAGAAACGSEQGAAAKPADSGGATAAQGEADAQAVAPESQAAVTASVATATSARFIEVADGVGVITTRVGRLAALAAPAASRITAVRVVVGQHVRAGQELVVIEPTVFTGAVSSANAALMLAEQATARAQRLVDAGVLPRKDAEQAAADLAAARAAAITARRTEELSRLRSPIDGVVTRLSAVLGANADPSQLLVEVADTRTLDVLLTLTPAAAALTRTGQVVTLFRAAADSQPIASARVTELSAVIDSTSRGVAVRAQITTTSTTLRLGENVYGRIDVVSHQNAIVIGNEALVPTGEGFQVFVVDSAGVAHARPVTIGGRAGARVWITDGITAGETIVTNGAFGMDDGARVVVRRAPSP